MTCVLRCIGAWLLFSAMLLVCLGCSSDVDSRSQLGIDTGPPFGFTGFPGGTEQVAGTSPLGRSVGSLYAFENSLWYVDPTVGIRQYAIAPESPSSGITDFSELREGALLVPRQQPAEVIQPEANTLVVRSKQGPFALELFTYGKDTTGGREESGWIHAGCYQRGHYDQLFAVSPTRIVAWDQTTGRLDCWSVDSEKRHLAVAWQWALPPNTTTLDIRGEALAISVTDTAFQHGGRARQGTGVMLYGLGDSPTEPTLHDRWMAPAQAPITGLKWLGTHGLVVIQGTALSVIQRQQSGRLKVLGSTRSDELLDPVLAAGGAVWLKGATGIRRMTLSRSNRPELLPEPQPGLLSTAPLAVSHGVLWYLEDVEGSPKARSDSALLLGAESDALQSHPRVALRGIRFGSSTPAPGFPESLTAASFPRDVATYANHAYLPLGPAGLAVVALGPNPWRPMEGSTLLRTMPITGGVDHIAIHDHWAYCTSSQGGWRVLDLRDPGLPTALPNMDHDSQGRGLALLQGRRLLAAQSALSIMRISQPGAIYSDATYPLPGEATGIATDYSRTYIACGDKGLQILDTGEGHPIIVLHQMDTGHHWGALAAEERLLAGVRSHTEVVLFDMTTVNTPRIAEVLIPGGQVTALAFFDGQLFVGARMSKSWGIVKSFEIGEDGTATPLGSQLMAGAPTAIAPGPDHTTMLVPWLADSGAHGVIAIPTIGGLNRMTRLDPIDIGLRTGPWLRSGSHLWTVDDELVQVRDLALSELPVIAETPFSLDPTIWTGKSQKTATDTLLRDTGQGALSVVRKGWVHMRATPYGTIATDPWPMKATEHVMATRDGSVLVWDHESLRYDLYRLFPDGAPEPLTGEGWAGTHPDNGGGAWEVVDAALATGTDSRPVYATAEAFNGARLYHGATEIDAIPHLQTTAVSVAGSDYWAAAGERLTRGDPQAVVIVRRNTATVYEHYLTSAPHRLWLSRDGRILLWWEGGVTIIWPDGVEATLPGQFSEVQLGPGWDIPDMPDELWVRESTSGTIDRWEIAGDAGPAATGRVGF